jgi:hypothetical protein
MLTYTRRCFGDKGDVEDITEGQRSHTVFTLSSREKVLLELIRMSGGADTILL